MTAAPPTTPPPAQLSAFLAAERQNESGGNYKAYNAAGGASGAYQFIQSTWSSWATKAGYGQYAGAPASAAPPQVQDAAAAAMATSYYSAFGGNWKDVAEAWYYPAWAGQPQYQNSVPYPSAGNTLTIGQYGDNVVASMAKYLGGSGPALTAAPNPVAPGISSGSGFWNNGPSIPGLGGGGSGLLNFATGPIKTYLLDGVLVVFGLVAILVGLVVASHGHGGSIAPPAGGGGGGGSSRSAEGESGEAGAAEDAALV